MASLKRLTVLLGAGALVFAMAGTALGVVTYATVDGHEGFSSDANAADYWGPDCVKLKDGDNDLGGMDSYELTANYGKVIVKAGSDGSFANTIFNDVTAGESVWADTNGDNTFNVGGPGGDKQISHIIVCDESTTTTTTTTDVTTTTTTDVITTTTTTDTFSSDTGGEIDEPSEPNTATIGTSTGAPADGAWLLVIALGVLLASIVVMTPAKARR